MKYIYWVYPPSWKREHFFDYETIEAESPRAARRQFYKKHPFWKGQEIVCEENGQRHDN